MSIKRNIRTYSDFSLTFNSHPYSSDVVVKTDEEAIKQSIKNLILTKNYSRPFHPEIGCQIHGLLFENWDPILENTMQQTISDLIDKFEPRVRLIDLKLNPSPDENSLDVTVEFQIKNSEKPVTLKTALTRVR